MPGVRDAKLREILVLQSWFWSACLQAGEMVQQLKVLTVLTEDPNLVPNTYLASQNHL